MTESMDAVFDGVSFKTTEPCAPVSQSFLDVAQSFDLQGPSDWSENFESYLYDAKAPNQ